MFDLSELWATAEIETEWEVISLSPMCKLQRHLAPVNNRQSPFLCPHKSTATTVWINILKQWYTVVHPEVQRTWYSQHAKSRKNVVNKGSLCTFIDLIKASDTVDCQALWSILSKNCHEYMKILRFLHVNTVISNSSCESEQHEPCCNVLHHHRPPGHPQCFCQGTQSPGLSLKHQEDPGPTSTATQPAICPPQKWTTPLLKMSFLKSWHRFWGQPSPELCQWIQHQTQEKSLCRPRLKGPNNSWCTDPLTDAPTPAFWRKPTWPASPAQ